MTFITAKDFFAEFFGSFFFISVIIATAFTIQQQSGLSTSTSKLDCPDSFIKVKEKLEGQTCTYATQVYLSSLVLAALAIGVALFIAIFVFGRYSGGHFNPAVTLAKIIFEWTTESKFQKKYIGYVLAQLLGATAAVFFVYHIFSWKNV